MTSPAKASGWHSSHFEDSLKLILLCKKISWLVFPLAYQHKRGMITQTFDLG